MAHYLVAARIRHEVRKNGKRVGRDFLHCLDVFVGNILAAACKQHNGGRKTLDAGVAEYLLRRRS